MTLTKPKFWDNKIGLLAILLFPFSIIFLFLVFLKKKFTRANTFKIPIICVGNIYIGGTGKTPISIFLANEFSKLGKSPAILRKYYKNHSDEYNLIKRYFNNLIITKNRFDGIKEAENSGKDVVVLDDGFQDYTIKKDIKIICFNQNQLIGNGLVLPAGPLRESLISLKDAQIVLINGNKDNYFEKKILNINEKLKIFYFSYKATNAEEFRSKKLFALAGIGSPENFFKLVKDNNLIIKKKLIFPDHYRFSKDEILKIVDEAENNDCQIIMTEKDYFKIKKFNIDKIRYLKVSLVVKNQENFISIIKNII